MSEGPVIVWLRQDLRTMDQPALAEAAASGRPVLPLYVLDDVSPGAWRIGGASRWWLHGSLAALAADLDRLGAPLLLRRGHAPEVIDRLAAEVGAAGVFCTRHVEPFWQAAEQDLAVRLTRSGIALRSLRGTTLFEPGLIAGRDGIPLRVFTPFWRACQAAPPPPLPTPAPSRLRAPRMRPSGDALSDWALRPAKPDWAGGLREAWQCGEAAAQAGLERFIDTDLRRYGGDRNRPEPGGTSRLSPHLHFGELSARHAWHAILARAEADGRLAGSAEGWLRELAWREFYAHVLERHPEMPDTPLQARFARFPWTDDAQASRSWERGRTGYPIVDAGMRQLWQSGWMHNRVRMITASFLIKDLLVPWQVGEAWFWDTLVDADLANNSGSWQWVAGSGNDPAPYFRIFNPVLQGEKFDAAGAYIRRWVPELARLPDRWIHRPWDAPPLDLEAAGVGLGRDYPQRVVDHGEARQRALQAFASLGVSK